MKAQTPSSTFLLQSLLVMELKDNFSIVIPLAAAILTIVLGTIFIIFTTRFHFGKSKKYHPVAGTVLHHLVNFRRLYDYTTELARRHGTYRILSFFRTEVYTSDPAIIEYILKTNFANYGKGKFHYNIMTDLVGDGIFAVDGEKWRQQRKLSSHHFSTKNLRDFSSSVFKTNAVKLARLLSQLAESNQPIEIQDLFMKATLDSVFKILLGVELDGICGTYEEGNRFSDAFDRASAITSFRYADIFWKIKRFLNIGSEAELKKNIKLVDEFMYKLIKRKIQQDQDSPKDLNGEKEDIISKFLEVKETDPKYLRDITLCFVIAGKDTTATTLSWFIYMLCKHPHIQEKIAKEVIEATKVSGDDSSFEEIAATLNEDTIDKMQYLHAALTETLRLYPTIPLNGKQCLSDDTLPDGFSVKKGDTVAYQPYVMGRLKHLWGDDAEEFKPERWLNENGIFQQESPFKFITFQAGPRICLGKEFAYRQMKIFSIILLGSYKFKLSDENQRANYRVMLTLNMEGGLHVCLSPRPRRCH